MKKRPDKYRVVLWIGAAALVGGCLVAWVKAWLYCASFTVGDMPGVCLLLVSK